MKVKHVVIGFLLIALGFSLSLLVPSGETNVIPTQTPTPTEKPVDLCDGFDFVGEEVEADCQGAVQVNFKVWGRIISDHELEVQNMAKSIDEDLGIYAPGSQVSIRPAQFQIIPVPIAYPGSEWSVGSFEPGADPRTDAVLAIPPDTPAGMVLVWESRSAEKSIEYHYETSDAWQFLPLIQVKSFHWVR